jgi:hypothetical protein
MDWDELPVREPGKAFTPGLLEGLLNFKGSIVEFLVREGSIDALSALRSVVDGCMRPEEVRWRLRDAERSVRARSYPWPTPKEVLDILDDAPRRRLVRTGGELLSAVSGSLDQLQAALHDETPAIRDLWDKQEGDRWRPIAEEELSDYVKRFLDQNLAKSGVIVNREVVVRSRLGKAGGPGQRTDVHVNVRLLDSGEEITNVIEVKGSWNPELLTAMEHQLAERYLSEKSYYHGVYLVFTFDCPQWDEEDKRREIAKKRETGDLVELLEKQARGLAASAGICIRVKVIDAALR